MRTECVITGVTLITPDGVYSLNGDLFYQGGTYIANCNEHSKKEIDSIPPGKIAKWVQPNHEAWERRGVWVFHEDDAQFSIAALEYMHK